ncbi:MAG: shikimate kinase [Desulfobacteraceae bacterium]|nr:shikimate kinase [Desulfobacteraceae bacterium]
MNKNVYLIGYRCTGKSSVGRCLADGMGMAFADADDIFEQRAGAFIAEYVAKNGWDAFRDTEAQILADLCRQTGLVVATGGGAVLRPENVSVMNNSGIVVWLTARPETIVSRMQADPATGSRRPAFGSDPVFREVVETLDYRTPLYKNTCQIEMATDDKDTDRICHDLVSRIKIG